MNAGRMQHVLELDAPVVLRRRSKNGSLPSSYALASSSSTR